MTGYTKAEAIGQKPSLLKSGVQDNLYYEGLWKTLIEGHVWTGHFVNRKKDGTLFEEEATISPVRNEAGKIVNYVAVKRDVTKEVELENQFLQSQKMEAIGRLAGGIAHDFNNLLTAIIGYSQMALLKLNCNERIREDFSEVQNAAQRAAMLTGQLLAFSRKQVFQSKILDLNAVVTDLQKMLRRLIGEDIELSAVLDLELGAIKADPGQIQQVIMNMAINARDAMPDGGKLTIETANVYLDSAYAARHIGVAPGSYVMLAVTDTGIGMSEGTLSHIFEPFYTTKEHGKGTGLGLSTVYGIVKQSGGNIWAYSEPDIGTTFKVYLPRAPERMEDSECASKEEPVAGGTETMLLAEDEDAVRTLSSQILSELGYRVLEARNGTEAVRVAAEMTDGQIGLLITDIIMPEMGGRTLVENLKRDRENLRVLYMSGYTDNSVVLNSIREEGTPFLQKPFSPDDLARKVREVLDN